MHTVSQIETITYVKYNNSYTNAEFLLKQIKTTTYKY